MPEMDSKTFLNGIKNDFKILIDDLFDTIENIKNDVEKLKAKKMETEKIEEIIGKILTEKKLTLSVAESCTGGLVSSRLTDISGSSSYIKINFITYSNEAKIKFLGVPENILQSYGAVSEQNAAAMAEGVRKVAGSNIGLSITGIAGPTGATLTKPVGLVYIGISNGEKTKTHKINADPHMKRTDIKFFASQEALDFLEEFVETNY